jgi:hypothetical protein
VTCCRSAKERSKRQDVNGARCREGAAFVIQRVAVEKSGIVVRCTGGQGKADMKAQRSIGWVAIVAEQES